MSGLLTAEEMAAGETVMRSIWGVQDEDASAEGQRALAAIIEALRASRAEVERLRGFLDDEAQKRYKSEVYADWRAQQCP